MSGFIMVASWMAWAKARSWSMGSPSLWIVIFCSTRVSTTPSRSILYVTVSTVRVLLEMVWELTTSPSCSTMSWGGTSLVVTLVAA
uniref:Putative secreted protein n=1 Tax=Ixodes ricinus TaxID=34613 RepID=A0A6B0U0W2_IXORI